MGFKAAAAVMVAAGVLAPAAEAATSARVVRVIDGNSVSVRAGGKVRTVQLRGVDAPEGSECFAAQSKARLKKLLPARARVKIEGAGATKFVTHGRTLVNEAIVRGGHARWTGNGSSARDRKIDSAQNSAEAAQRGLWRACPQDAPKDADPGQPQPAPANGPRMSQAQWQAFLEGFAFTRASSSSNTGGSFNQNTFFFCPNARYVFRSESFSNGLNSNYAEGGSWRIVKIERDAAAQADVATLEFVTEQSSDPDFNPGSPPASRTFGNTVTSFDDQERPAQIDGKGASREPADCTGA